MLIAYSDNGQLLTDTGFARLVVPDDIRGGRYDSIVVDATLDRVAAMGLYRPFGFREVARSTRGDREILWFELRLTPALRPVRC